MNQSNPIRYYVKPGFSRTNSGIGEREQVCFSPGVAALSSQIRIDSKTIQYL
jgi:hypothetical protein